MSPCSDCFTNKKETENETEQKHSKYNGNLNQSKIKSTANDKSTKTNSSNLDSTAVASRPRISTGKNIRRNRSAFNNQCSDPDCPFNRTRVRQTVPAPGMRTRAPRRTQTHRNADGGKSGPRRVKRTKSYLPPPPDVTPPLPPRTPLPPFPRQKSFIHDKYITTENIAFYPPSPSPELDQYKNQNILPVPLADSRISDSHRFSAGEEVLKSLRRLRPLKKSTYKDSPNSENLKGQYDAYTSSNGSSHGDLTSNTTQGYIPPPPPMPPYRNDLKPSKNTVLPEEKTKPITVVDTDSSKKTNLTSRIGPFKRFHKKGRNEKPIEVIDLHTNQKYNLKKK